MYKDFDLKYRINKSRHSRETKYDISKDQETKWFKFKGKDHVMELKEEYMKIKLKKFENDIWGKHGWNEYYNTKISETTAETRDKKETKITADSKEKDIYSKVKAKVKILLKILENC